MTGHQHPSCWLQHVPGSARWLIALGAWLCFLLGFGYCVVDSDLGSGYGSVCFFHVIFLRYFCVLYAVCVSLYLCAILDDVFLGFFCFIAASAFVSWSFFCSFWHSSCSWHCLAFLLVSCSMYSGLLVVIVGIRLPQCFILFYFIFTSSILISSSHFPWTFCLTIFFSTSFFSFRWYIVPLFPLFSLSICSLLSCCPLLEIFLFFLNSSDQHYSFHVYFVFYGYESCFLEEYCGWRSPRRFIVMICCVEYLLGCVLLPSWLDPMILSWMSVMGWLLLWYIAMLLSFSFPWILYLRQ